MISSLQALPESVPMLARLAFWPPLITAMIDDNQLDRAEVQIAGLEQAATRHVALAWRRECSACGATRRGAPSA